MAASTETVALISYAQNGEDVVLARLFDRDHGFYVDIGAGHPVVDSVTKHFSERGWTGLNVEPLPEEHALLCEDRPRDRCVRAAATDRNGHATLHVAPAARRGWATIVDDFAPTRPDGSPVPTIEVPAVRLCDLLAQHGVDHIDFLKIDVEGSEAAIVNDTDWTRIRPRALVIEATLPGRRTPSHEGWEPALLRSGYRCTLFDGLNRWYVQDGDDEAAAALSVPANVHDEAEPYVWVSQLRALMEELEREKAVRDRAESQLDQIQGEVAALAELGRHLGVAADPGTGVLTG